MTARQVEAGSASPASADLPNWPRWLSRMQAAAFVGVSATLFDAEVKAGLWPGPIRRGARGGRITWDRKALEDASDKLSGLGYNMPGAEAMRRLRNGNHENPLPGKAS